MSNAVRHPVIVTRHPPGDHPLRERFAAIGALHLTPEGVDPKHLPPPEVPFVLLDLAPGDLERLLPSLTGAVVRRPVFVCTAAPTPAVAELCFLHAVHGPLPPAELADLPWERLLATRLAPNPLGRIDPHSLLRALDHHVRNRLCTIQQAAYLAADDARAGRPEWSHLKRVEVASADIELAIARLEELTVDLPDRPGSGDLLDALRAAAETLCGESGSAWVLPEDDPGHVVRVHPDLVERIFLEVGRHLVFDVCVGEPSTLTTRIVHEGSFTNCTLSCDRNRDDGSPDGTHRVSFRGIDGRGELSLAIAHRLVEHVGGSMHGDRSGAGTQILVRLPAY